MKKIFGIALLNLGIATLVFVGDMQRAAMAADDRCEAILQNGIWDVHQSQSDTQQTSSFLNWFCSQQFESLSDAKEAGGKIGVPIENIPVEISGFNKESSWKEYQAAACSMQSGQYQNISLFSSFTKQASPVLADAWAKCVSGPGFYATVSYVDDPTVFTIQLNYVGLSPTDKATVTSLLTRPKGQVTCEPGVSSDRPLEIGNGLEITFLCDRPKNKPASVVVNADRKITPSGTLNVKTVNSNDFAEYREVSNEVVKGRAAWNSDTIVIKAGANIEIQPNDDNPSLNITAKTLKIEGPFTINGKGLTGQAGAAQTGCARGGCSWESGPKEDSSRAHDSWIAAGLSDDDKGQSGLPGGKGGRGAAVVFRYATLEGNSGDAQCNVPGGDGGVGGAGGRGRQIIDGSNPGNFQKAGPQGDQGPQGPAGEAGKCTWEQTK